jgi:pyruvate carboxylase
MGFEPARNLHRIHLRAIDAPTDDLQQLTESINGMAALADRAVTDARLKSKELEIQLKVAMAERQHAEAILYSISDAVLVTDRLCEAAICYTGNLNDPGQTKYDLKYYVRMARELEEAGALDEKAGFALETLSAVKSSEGA